MTHHQAPTAGAPRMARIPCLVNVSAGNGKAVLEAVERDARFAVRTCEPAELPDAVHDALEEGVPRIAVAGGDGTIAAVAGALVRSDVELAVLPAGTRDHFVRSLEIPIRIEEALDVAAGTRSRWVDVGFVNERLFLNTSSVGAYVDFVHERERHRRWMGYHLGSLIAAASILARPTALAVAVTFEEEHRRYRTPLVFLRLREREGEVWNDRRVPGGEGDDDGNGSPVLRLGVVRGRTRIRLTALALTTAVRGLDVASRTPHLKNFFVSGCTIEVPAAETYVAVDGETIRMSTPLTYRTERRVLRVVVA